MRGHFFQECMRESSSSHDERFAKTRGNRDVRGSKLRGRTRRAIIGSIIPGNDSPAEGNWSLVIPPGLLRAGNNYGFAVNRSDSRSLHSERKREGEREKDRQVTNCFISLALSFSFNSRPRKANEKANTTAKPISIGR